MSFSIKKELETTDIKNFLPQELTPKLLSYIGVKVNDFLDQVTFSDSSSENASTITFDPDILDIVTTIYVSQNGDHDIDVSNISNFMKFQKKISQGAINYCLAVYRETLGRDSGIDYENPKIENILTKKPETYDCKKLFEHHKNNKCNNCSSGNRIC
ncbi:MAG: hypothetical protein J7K84_04475 [Deltaproteobacteria bacterium]|nr:hypothetical protein [Deltaproteobacteria bacterium]